MDSILNQDYEIYETGNVLETNKDIFKTKKELEEALNEVSIDHIIFDLKKREKDGTIYKYLGVKEFRKTLKNIIEPLMGRKTNENGRSLNNYSMPSYDKLGIEKAIRKGKYNETVHIMGSLVALSGIISEMAACGDMSYINLACFLLNFYCVILQRYTRGRLTSVLEKK